MTQHTMEVGIEIKTAADVTRSEHAEECLAAHPGEACPGYPHQENEDAR